MIQKPLENVCNSRIVVTCMSSKKDMGIPQSYTAAASLSWPSIILLSLSFVRTDKVVDMLGFFT